MLRSLRASVGPPSGESTSAVRSRREGPCKVHRGRV